MRKGRILALAGAAAIVFGACSSGGNHRPERLGGRQRVAGGQRSQAGARRLDRACRPSSAAPRARASTSWRGPATSRTARPVRTSIG